MLPSSGSRKIRRIYPILSAQTAQSIYAPILFDYSLGLKYYLFYEVRNERIGKDSNK